MECQVCGACGPLVESDDEYTGEKAAIRAHNTCPAPPIEGCAKYRQTDVPCSDFNPKE